MILDSLVLGNKEIIVEKIVYQVGVIGLGVMGHNLVLNIGEHEFSVIGYDVNSNVVARLNAGSRGFPIKGVNSVEEFVLSLDKPRNIMLLVPAGAVVDNVIRDLIPRLDHGDMIIDCGNSHYKDTDTRMKWLSELGLLSLGVGISGGANGARYGPSMMVGGSVDAYQRVEDVFEAIAAKVNNEPCVTFLGPGSAGHYVKMVHNGIEYGLMQLIAESYDLMKRGLGLQNEEIQKVFNHWNKAELNAYLVEITASIFGEIDAITGENLIDFILDEAKQKGTGMWTSQDGMELQVPAPTIDIAVRMRNMSAMKSIRKNISNHLGVENKIFPGEQSEYIKHLGDALYAGMVLTYTQGFNQLYTASSAYNYQLDLESIARIWRGGCIIRSTLLEKIRIVFQKKPNLSNLLLDHDLGDAVMKRRDDLKTIVTTALDMNVPTPGMSVSLSYLDGLRSAWLPANLIQAQRDYFGAHTYERVDKKGVFHTEWQMQRRQDE